jgi:chromosome segregation ATPase
MNTNQLKDKLLSMKDKADKYDKLLISYNYLTTSINFDEKDKQIQDLQDKISSMTGDIDDMKNASYDKSKTIKGLNFEINNLESTIENHETVNSMLLENIKIKQLDIDEFSECIIDLKDKLQVMTGFSKLYHNSKDIFGKYEKLKTNYENIVEENKSLLMSNNYLRSDVEKLTKYNSNFITQIEEAHNEIAQLKEENKKMSEITKTFIEELGVSDWDLVSDMDPPSV